MSGGWLTWMGVLGVLVGSTLRFWEVTTKGLALTDEAGYVLIVQTLLQPVVWLVSRVSGGLVGDFTTHMNHFMGPFGEQVGYTPGDKPGFYLLLIIFGAPIGLPPYTAILVSALFGSLSLVLVWRVASAGGDRWLGVWSTILLALSPYHLLYSRLGFANIPASAFLLAAVLLGLRSYGAQGQTRERQYLVFSGLSLGYAFLVHPVVLPHIVAFGCVEAVALLLDREPARRRHTLWRLKWLAVSLLAPLLSVEALTWAALFIKSRLLPSVTWHQTYFITLFGKILGDVVGRGSPELAFQVSVLNLLEGMLSLVALLVGTAVCLLNFRQVFYRMVAFQVWLPLLLWSVTALQLPRSFAGALPFWSLIVALGAIRGAEWISQRISSAQRKVVEHAAVAIIVAVIILWRLPMLGEILTLHSGYREAVTYLRQHGVERHISTQRAISQIYVGIPNAVSPPQTGSVQSLSHLVAKGGYRYLLADAREVNFPSVAQIRGRCQPVASIPNPTGGFWPLLVDEIQRKDWIATAQQNPHRTQIELFDLQDCLSRVQ